MQLESRLKKLEMPIGTNCQCLRGRTEVYFSKEISGGVFTEPSMSGEPIPDVCDQCKRPIEKERMDIKFVKSRIPHPRREATI